MTSLTGEGRREREKEESQREYFPKSTYTLWTCLWDVKFMAVWQIERITREILKIEKNKGNIYSDTFP